MGTHPKRAVTAGRELEIFRPRMARPFAQVIIHPDCEIDDFQLGTPRFRFRAREEEEAFDDLSQVNGPGANHPENALIFGYRAISTQRHVDLAEQPCQRSSELMRGVARKPPLALQGLVETIQ